jgi:hypothetical protein
MELLTIFNLLGIYNPSEPVDKETQNSAKFEEKIKNINKTIQDMKKQGKKKDPMKLLIKKP